MFVTGNVFDVEPTGAVLDAWQLLKLILEYFYPRMSVLLEIGSVRYTILCVHSREQLGTTVAAGNMFQPAKQVVIEFKCTAANGP
jgi:hypothetical protein